MTDKACSALNVTTVKKKQLLHTYMCTGQWNIEGIKTIKNVLNQLSKVEKSTQRMVCLNVAKDEIKMYGVQV